MVFLFPIFKSTTVFFIGASKRLSFYPVITTDILIVTTRVYTVFF